MSNFLYGDVRRDKWGVVWLFDGGYWVMATNNDGTPVVRMSVSKFEPENDPSGDESPHLYDTLVRVENKLDRLLAKEFPPALQKSEPMLF